MLRERRKDIVDSRAKPRESARAAWIVVMALGALSLTPAMADVYVDDGCSGTQDGTAQYPFCTIQDGVDAVQNSGQSGDVLVKSGTYTGAGNTEISIPTLVGTVYCESPETDPCTIDCQGSGRAFDVSRTISDILSVQGFVIQNGDSTNGGAMRFSGGVVWVSDMDIWNCSALLTGGGIYVAGRGISVFDTTVRGCSASYNGGGIAIIEGGTVDGCTIGGPNPGDGNEAARGGGIYVLNTSMVTSYIRDSLIEGNVADADSGASYGGGIGFVGPVDPSSPTGTLEVSGCIVRGNSAKFQGGGIGLDGGDLDMTLRSSEVSCNDSERSFGGGIGSSSQNAGDHNLMVESSIVTGNTAYTRGGGIAFDSSDSVLRLRVHNSLVSGNRANGGGAAAGGGGIHARTMDEFEILNTTIANNISPKMGGGIDLAMKTGSTGSITNSILWLNELLGTHGFGTQLAAVYPSPVIIRYSDLEGGSDGYSGGGVDFDDPSNITGDPLYVDASNNDECATANDYHLQAGSPVIDRGDNTPLIYGAESGTWLDPDATAVDLGGASRITDDPDAPDNGDPDGLCGIVDMGAFEHEHASFVIAAQGDRKSRYLSFQPPASTAEKTAIRVRAVKLPWFPEPEEELWVGPPQEYPDEYDEPLTGLTFTAAALQCEPYVGYWDGVNILHVFGAEILPGSLYEVQTIRDGCLNSGGGHGNFDWNYSTNVSMATGKWGDTVPLFDGDDPSVPQPDFNDIAGVVNKFLGTPTAPIKAFAQLQPNRPFPDRKVDFRDVAAAVDGFLGVSYASRHYGPCSCPSAVTCGTTSCDADFECRVCQSGVCSDGATPCSDSADCKGLCVDNFCTDACGRCTPAAP